MEAGAAGSEVGMQTQTEEQGEALLVLFALRTFSLCSLRKKKTSNQPTTFSGFKSLVLKADYFKDLLFHVRLYFCVSQLRWDECCTWLLGFSSTW